VYQPSRRVRRLHLTLTPSLASSSASPPSWRSVTCNASSIGASGSWRRCARHTPPARADRAAPPGGRAWSP